MKLTRAISFVAILASAMAIGVHATELQQQNLIKQKLKNTLGMEVKELTPSPIAGLYQMITRQGVMYVTKDGSKLIHGNVYDLNKGMENLTEQALAGPRKALLKKFKNNMLVYKAKDEKHVVTVFTDITCGYCRKLHNEMSEYNDKGITVRYLAFPRQGVPSANATEMESIWCAKNPNMAMDRAQSGGDIAPASCDAKISEQYQAGGSIGVNGTPAIILEDGSMVPGYQNADNLYQALEPKS